ncbi:PREDICTED: uncharacterized protein At1g01500-like [Tarenaya hassleriana]|uniref:uncharacterized protein At1g01500-like n=1 Tax=Tarenaya hassleriana TaxID=28532 RepID=UPI00053C6A15|nr:PREDICTED: uncharacterized protein At1g01500-like [Tarenaya hassleriana]XP_010519105.1 PREDICTED: uncharacterized protein At1g01500-like [Tarenaya hassleriana]
MEEPYNGGTADSRLQIVKYAPYNKPCEKFSLPWLDLRVFYVRISNFLIDESTPSVLTLNHVPLSPDTVLEVNGVRCNMSSEGISSVLRRDRADKKSEEATFVTTDCIRLTGNVRFEVYDKGDLILSGVLEICSGNGYAGESESNAKNWSMNCEMEITAGSGFLKGKHIVGPESPLPTIEVYVAGCFSGKPIILTKTMQLGFKRKQTKKGTLDSIPENDIGETEKNPSAGVDHQMKEYDHHKLEYEEEEYQNMYWRRNGEYMEGEDGEMSWFNAGVRVGVGIGLGICVGVGIGVGLLVRTYQSTTRSFRRRLP